MAILNQISNLADFSLELAHLKKIRGHVKSHKKLGPDQFSRKISRIFIQTYAGCGSELKLTLQSCISTIHTFHIFYTSLQ